MTELIRTDSANSDLTVLLKQLDAYLAEKDGDEHSFYAQHNKLDKIRHVIIAYEGKKAVGCGAIKEFSKEAIEVKRMYTVPERRGKGIAGSILAVLEKWAAELGYKKCILETGKKQTEAILLYQKHGYRVIPNYGPYVNAENSLCFEKEI
jgi:putative acetyltransferase